MYALMQKPLLCIPMLSQIRTLNAVQPCAGNGTSVSCYAVCLHVNVMLLLQILAAAPAGVLCADLKGARDTLTVGSLPSCDGGGGDVHGARVLGKEPSSSFHVRLHNRTTFR